MVKTIAEGLLKTSAIVAAALSLFYIVTLDSITNVWQYGVCLICIIWLLFVLVIKWDALVRFVEENETEIVDIDEYKKK